MLTRLRLVHFKGFDDFTVTFGGSAVLVGPNNAGKSTIVSALRLCGAAIRTAHRLKAQDAYADGDRWVRGYPLAAATGSGFVAENVRYEFIEQPSRLELAFSTGAVLHVVWPVDAPSFFWAEHPKGMQVVAAAKAKAALHPIGIVPTLTPLDDRERVLSAEHVRSNRETRLASRHFRNQLAVVQDADPEGYAALVDYLLEHTPELLTLELVRRPRDGGLWLDLYYRDGGARTEKEIYWAGDGLQIWLQLLFHLWRNRESPSVVLDEPDVFLHPDLQRRLVRVLDAASHQSITATHAPEMASEAQQGSLLWIERNRRRAVRVSDDAGLADLSGVLGSGFNLSVARALRSKVALFVEGEDMKILRALARNVGAESFTSERGLTVIGIGGFSHWPSVEAFAWIKSELLGSAVDVRLLLDRDYRGDAECAELVQQLGEKGVNAHVWTRKELESYLLVPSALSRLTKLTVSEIGDHLSEIADAMRNDVVGQLVSQEIANKPRSLDMGTATSTALKRADQLWADRDALIGRLPAKAVLSELNRRLQLAGSPAVSWRRLAASLRTEEVPIEMQRVITGIEEALNS